MLKGTVECFQKNGSYVRTASRNEECYLHILQQLTWELTENSDAKRMVEGNKGREELGFEQVLRTNKNTENQEKGSIFKSSEHCSGLYTTLLRVGMLTNV